MSSETCRILIVEDEPSHAEAIRRSLLKADTGLMVRIAADLKSYREQVAALPPDIVLLDLNLPDGNALECLSQEPSKRDYPILIMTSYGSEALAVEALKSGALDYIVKSPESFTAMPRIVERSLREWRFQRDHRQAISALRESEQRFRTLLQDVRSVAVQGFGPDGIVHYWNRASEELYGYSAAEAIGQDLCELIMPKAMRSEARRNFRDMAETGVSLASAEYQLRRKDGSRVVVFSSHTVLNRPGKSPELYSIDIDITERKRNELQLSKLSRAVEQSPAVVVITDLGGNIEYVNPLFTKLTGYSAAEVIGKNPRILQSGEMSATEYQQLWACLTAGEDWHGEFHNKRKDGTLFWERALISPLRNEQGKITHYIGIKEDITTYKIYEKQLEYQATHDTLTGLVNRSLLKDRIDQAIHHANRSGKSIALLLLDLDRFKKVNDSLGHGRGDELLCLAAARLQRLVRETDTVARFGGDEFVILLTEVANPDDISLLAEKILKRLSEPFPIAGHNISLSASLGISVYPHDGNGSDNLIRFADIAMYQAKKKGDQFAFYSKEMNLHMLENLELEGALRRGLDRKEFQLHYQPKVDLRTGRVYGCEALIRWYHPDRGMVSPGTFIPLAEETGLIVPMGTWVIQEACRQIKDWQQAGLPKLAVSVNLSARQFRQGDLYGIVRSALEETLIPPELLELELTESMIMDDPEAAEEQLNRLKQLGVCLSLDDFGTGYSSLNYLRRFPVDCLKIDQSFINDVTTDPTGASVVASIIDVAHNLKLSAIAEGVETTPQLDFLMANGCDAMQGYLFSAPVPASRIPEMLGRKLPMMAIS